ncbi:hypothetical protein CEQ21_22150 [Niallia circulans]|uniref:ABC-2 type transport system permease protein n=1 Tax=Niallia circulans TaxID=1397 RepID=A0A553SMA8_NIACI|nr:hypothetical protein [Niallia circulans]TRZ38116.1 hypothetical protein CEQ21_22150 [Niallia circulans]
MPLKKTYYYKQLSLLTFRNVGWLGIISFLALFFAVPMHLILMDKKDYRRWERDQVYSEIFDINILVQAGIMIIIPLLLGIFLFRYIQSKAYSDLIHSLPVSRSFLFHFFTWNGFFVLIVPIILNAIIIMAAYWIIDLHQFISFAKIFSWIGIFTIFTAIVYFTCIFVGMLTGLSITQGVFSVLLLLFPAGIIYMVFYNFSSYVHGFPVDKYISDKLIYLSPILAPVIIYSDYSAVKVFTSYIVVCAILYIAAMLLYKKRNTETVYQTLTVSNLGGLFKYTVTICFMLLFGLYFQLINQGLPYHLFGLLIGSFIGYLVGEMFLMKSWRVFNRLKGYLFFLLAGIIVAVVAPFLNSKYEEFVPEVEDIKSVRIEQHNNYTNDTIMGLTSEENKTLVTLMHKELIKTDTTYDQDYYNDRINLTVVYELKNRKVTRSYSIKKDVSDKLLKPIYETKEFRQKLYNLDTQDDISKVKVDMPNGQTLKLTDKKELNNFLTVLMGDKRNESFGGMTNLYELSASVAVERKDGTSDYFNSYITVNNEKTINWLQIRGFQNLFTMDSQYVDKMYIVKSEEVGDNYSDLYSIEEIESKISKFESKAEVESKEQQSDILAKFVYPNQKYMVFVKPKYQDEVTVNFISEDDLPDSIKQKLKN